MLRSTIHSVYDRGRIVKHDDEARWIKRPLVDIDRRFIGQYCRWLAANYFDEEQRDPNECIYVVPFVSFETQLLCQTNDVEWSNNEI